MSSTTETLSDINHLLSVHSTLVRRVRNTQRAHRDDLRALPSPPETLLQLPLIRTPSPSPPPSPYTRQSQSHSHTPTPAASVPSQNPRVRTDLPPEKRVRLARYAHYIPEEETFRNNFCQRYVDCGDWPQNWVLGADLERRFEEYPKQQRLSHLKKAAVESSSLPAHYLPLNNLRTMPPSKFDVILLDPPYHSPSFSWEALSKFPIPLLASDPSFVFMWVGSGAGDGLERGREVLSQWGYRRCEDVVWVKTNKTINKGPGTDPPTSSLLTRTKQHCLMGIRGTVRRSTDHWFVHCNIDTDVIIWEGDPEDPTRKPPEMYALIESFCLGARRLEIFGRRRPAHPLRRGWVTVLLDDDGDMGAIDKAKPEEKEVDSRASSVAGDGDEEDGMADVEDSAAVNGATAEQAKALEGLEGAVLWRRERWEREVREACQAPVGSRVVVVPSTTEIDVLRPKSPTRNTTNNNLNMNASGAGGMSMAGPAFPTALNPMANMGLARTVPLQPSFRGPGPALPQSVPLNQGHFPMMSPPMRIGHGVMNPGIMNNQMTLQMGQMGISNPAMALPLSNMMVSQMGQMGQMGQTGQTGMGMGLFPQMAGMGMGINMGMGMGMGGNMGMNGMGGGFIGTGMPSVMGPMGGGSMGMGMGMNAGLNGFGDTNGFQNGFAGQPGFGGASQMNMHRTSGGGGWGY